MPLWGFAAFPSIDPLVTASLVGFSVETAKQRYSLVKDELSLVIHEELLVQALGPS